MYSSYFHILKCAFVRILVVSLSIMPSVAVSLADVVDVTLFT